MMSLWPTAVVVWPHLCNALMLTPCTEQAWGRKVAEVVATGHGRKPLL